MADAKAIQDILEQGIPQPFCELVHGDAWTLLIATILSAQSTDRRVNMVTPDLFTRWSEPASLADADIEEVEECVRSTGFFRNKAKAITGASRMIVEEFGGVVPNTLAELVKLPGVARKTANVVLGTAYGIASGMVVDTHAGRVARRLGLTTEKKAVKVERDLCANFPQETWPDMSHRLVLFGRYHCTARRPDCADCPLHEHCLEPDADTGNSLPDRIQALAAKIPEPHA